jgi:hypothetical protein
MPVAGRYRSSAAHVSRQGLMAWHAVNACMRCVVAGPSKSVTLVDEEGNQEEVEFADKREFERWAVTNTLKLALETGRKRYINSWEQLQDGGKYITTKSLEGKVSESGQSMLADGFQLAAVLNHACHSRCPA